MGNRNPGTHPGTRRLGNQLVSCPGILRPPVPFLIWGDTWLNKFRASGRTKSQTVVYYRYTIYTISVHDLRKIMKTRKRRVFKRQGVFCVYILECRSGTFYTGSTNDIENRIKLHNSGKGAKYTRDRRPVKLVWCKEYKYFKNAFLEEKRIKTLTRLQKEELVNGKTK